MTRAFRSNNTRSGLCDFCLSRGLSKRLWFIMVVSAVVATADKIKIAPNRALLVEPCPLCVSLYFKRGSEAEGKIRSIKSL